MPAVCVGRRPRSGKVSEPSVAACCWLASSPLLLTAQAVQRCCCLRLLASCLSEIQLPAQCAQTHMGHQTAASTHQSWAFVDPPDSAWRFQAALVRLELTQRKPRLHRQIVQSEAPWQTSGYARQAAARTWSAVHIACCACTLTAFVLTKSACASRGSFACCEGTRAPHFPIRQLDSQ